MKLYAVLPGLDYEGYGKPLFITDDLAKAEALARIKTGYDYIDIEEYELNKPT